MTIGGKNGEGYIKLNAFEMAMFLNGVAVRKKSGDKKGIFNVTLKLTRPRSKARRFPKEWGYDPKK